MTYSVPLVEPVRHRARTGLAPALLFISGGADGGVCGERIAALERFSKPLSIVFNTGFLVACAAGLYLRQYVAVSGFVFWALSEWFYRGNTRTARSIRSSGRLSPLEDLLQGLSPSDPHAEILLYEKISRLRVEAELTDQEERWLERMRGMMQLRGLIHGGPHQGKNAVRHAMAFSVVEANELRLSPTWDFSSTTGGDVTEAATIVADLYWNLFELCRGDFGKLTRMASTLYKDLFQAKFEYNDARARIERIVDTIHRDNGTTSLVLGLLKKGEVGHARQIAGTLLAEQQGSGHDDLISSLYWIAEIYWFTREMKTPIVDFETSIRYLYHLCFTNPERAGFLEIDSQFFSQFETVNELAREGFLFKDVLIEKITEVWGGYECSFDEIFQGTLEVLTGVRSKIFRERENWVRYWSREGENSSKDYLYVVEGNLAYAAGYYLDAKAFYDRAIAENSEIRSARLNYAFCLARLGNRVELDAYADQLMQQENLLPTAIFVLGDCYLLLGDERMADKYYAQLKEIPGWERKSDYYRSTFCFENGLYDFALTYARRAFAVNPEDASISYHLSLCYNAVGEKEEALKMVHRVSNAPEWLNYYRFTLERDAGRHAEASSTLLTISRDYFEDPDELRAAVEFAKGQQNLALLRHLKAR